ncbi:uracil-DNA glycosylase [Mycoplasma elephantis]|uniref:uracil-DNA glycosylase n=1 Tax=Mycoplasma elephantis TaxID=114882 RepID=UPI00056D752F|nr:uracil-DNA glycosylase [Mycoplasma elephantis]
MINYVKQELEKEYVKEILDKIKILRKTRNIFPSDNDIFSVFEKTNFNDLKVIIIGQDPYYISGVADGLAFSSKTILPKSLKNIFLEIKKDYPDFTYSTNCLDKWANQGVLLLNTILSVEENQPLSHEKIGWYKLTKNIFKYIIENNSELIICIWGIKAKEFVKDIDLSKHIILNNSHPSPLGYYRNFKDKHIFKQINDNLEKILKKPINWNL